VNLNITPLISARIISAAGCPAAFWAPLGYMCFPLGMFLVAGPDSLYPRDTLKIALRLLWAVEQQTLSSETRSTASFRPQSTNRAIGILLTPVVFSH
jgi:hypothetical protein